MDVGRKISWFKIAGNQWQTKDHRGYVGTIAYVNGGGLEYTLTITPGPVVSTHDHLGTAKNEYRKFLHTVPVS